LLDRSLLLGLERIPSHQRKPEQRMWEEFETASTQILGAAFDALSDAMRILPSIQLTRPTRMADFAVWGCAIAEALGHSQSEFLDAYERNYTERNEEILASDPVATLIVSFMKDRETWEGSASDLLGELESLTRLLRVSTRTKTWPKTPNVLSRRLNVVAANLAATGIAIQRGRETDGRVIQIDRRRSNDDSANESSSLSSSRIPEKSRESDVRDDSDGNDDISGKCTPLKLDDDALTPIDCNKSAPGVIDPGNIVTVVNTVMKRGKSKVFDESGNDDNHDESSVESSNGGEAAEENPTANSRDGFDL